MVHTRPRETNRSDSGDDLRAGHPQDAPLAALLDELVTRLGARCGLAICRRPGAAAAIVASSLATDCLRAMAQLRSVRVDPNGEAIRWHDGGDGAAWLVADLVAMPEHVMMCLRFDALPDDDRIAERLGALLPLVRPAFAFWTIQQRAAARVHGLTAAVESSDVGVALVGQSGQLLFANAAAARLIEKKDGLVRRGDTLGCSRLEDTWRLHAAIDHVATEGEHHAPAPVLAIHRDERRPLMTSVVGTGAPEGEWTDCAAIVYLVDPEQDLRAMIEPACRHYALSPVETRLTALIADGATLAEAAKKMRVREQTARSYLKQIFLKTATSRQAELVWLMLKSSVRTAQHCLSRLG